jgi:hypothetical protein
VRAVAAVLFLGLLPAAGLAAGVEGKREGRYLTGLPLVNFTSDTGVGYGARVYVNDNGRRGDARFDAAPYLAQVWVQYFATTGGWSYHGLHADLPFAGGTPWRVRTEFIYDRNTDQHYFGAGETSLARLPGGTYARYRAALDAAEPLGPGSTSSRALSYDLERPHACLQLERRVAGPVSVMAGFTAERSTVRTYDGRTVRVNGVGRVQGPTRLATDAPRGIAGGWTNPVRAGVAVDTRDYEPAPRTGWFADLTAEASLPALGSDYRFTRQTLTVRRYQPVVRNLVAAVRGSCALLQGDPPFYALSTLGCMDGRVEGLGGGWSLRGYKENRFTGPVTALADIELRYDAASAVIAGQHFLVTPVVFGDAGRVWDRAAGLGLSGYRTDVGGGVRIAWNRATIVNATWGRSAEDTNLFIDFGHQF